MLRVFFVVLCLSLGFSAAQAASVAVTPSDTTVSVGDDFWIRIEADAFSDLKAYDLIFQYDPAIVQLVGANPGNVLTGSYFA